MIKRICLYGGPGAGKSTRAAQIFASLKTQNYNVELIQEYIKPRAYAKRKVNGHEGLYIFSKQLQSEHQILPYVSAIITDCPLLLCAAHASYANYTGWRHMLELSKLYENDYPALHFWLTREYYYQPIGRYETEEVALDKDIYIKNFVSQNCQLQELSSEEQLNTIKRCILL